jgi:predicted N-formylglutamate amidohydrolase
LSRKLRFVVTCEHASRAVPKRFAPLIAGYEATLASHRGWDEGALPFARRLAKKLGAPLVAGNVTRLLVDLNRAETNRRGIFGSIGKAADEVDRQWLLERRHRPYRAAVVDAIREGLGGGPVLLLSIHSFAPERDGIVRNADVGLLYDPARSIEKERALAIEEGIVAHGDRVRRNYPYRGISDGVATAMRKVFSIDPDRFAAVEIELNQRLRDEPGRLPTIADLVAAALTPTGRK